MQPEDDGENPFERFDIDPLGGPSAITERMRELIEEAADEPTKKAIRAAWEELTLHPARRLAAALAAHPESHGPRGAPPPPVRRTITATITSTSIALEDLALRPSVLDALGAGGAPALPDVPFDLDPILSSRSGGPA